MSPCSEADLPERTVDASLLQRGLEFNIRSTLFRRA